jgi:hypothetical protein
MVHDAIRNYNTRSFSFIEKFSTDFIYNHTFEEPVKVFDNNLLLYKINFKAKPKVEGDSLFASGAIYIQPDDYSIHKLEYSCFYKTRSEQSKKMFNIDVEYGYENSVNSVMCLKYISFNNIFKVLNRDDISNFRLLDSYLDTIHGLEPSIILRFNNKIDPVSAIRKSNYEVTAGRKPVKINGIQVVGNTLYIRLKAYDSKDSRDSCKVDIKTITDINGQRLGQRKSLELYQYRELFVQEYNKPLPLTDSCYMDYLPLGKNCISKYRGNEKYWMNTPENIKGIK